MWEHKAVLVKVTEETLLEVLEREGKDGWEPWYVEVISVYRTVFFKRRKEHGTDTERD